MLMKKRSKFQKLDVLAVRFCRRQRTSYIKLSIACALTMSMMAFVVGASWAFERTYIHDWAPQRAIFWSLFWPWLW